MSRGASKPMSDEEEDSDSNSSIESLSSSSWKIEPKVETLKPSSCSPKVIDFSDSSSECSDGTYEAKVLSYLNGISIQENSKTEEKSLSTSKIEVDISSSSWESDSSLEPSFRYSSRTLAKKKIWDTLEKSMEEDNNMRRVKKLKKKRNLQVVSPTPEPVPTEIYPDAGLRRNLILKQIQIAHLSKRQLKNGHISEENHPKPEELGLKPGFSEELGLKPGFSEQPEFEPRFKKGLGVEPRFDEKRGLESSINDKRDLVSSIIGRNDIESSHGDKPEVESSRNDLESTIEKWVCEVCNLDFETNPQLNSHMVNKHEGLVNFLCQNCGHPFYEATLYNTHFQKEHSNKTTLVSCYLCRAGEFPDFVTLLEHFKTSHVTTDLYQVRCSECGGVFISCEVFDRHYCEKLKMCHQYLMGCFSDKVRVKLGGENAEGGTLDRTKFEGGNDSRLRDNDGSIVNGTDLERGRDNSRLRDQSMDVLACDQCGSIFKAKKYLKQHLAVHHRVLDVFECYICRRTFGAKYKLTEHFSIVHSGTSYNCEVCGKGFQSKFTLVTHMKKHTGNFEVFTCVECSQEFNRKQLLVEHVGDMNRRCLWCDMWLGCRTKLLEHIEENHRRVGRLECTECRRDVHSLTKFWNHLIVYHPEQCRIVNKNCVICDKCRQLCSSRHHLKKHQRKLCLVSERNVCKHCNVRFGANYLHGVHLGRVLRCAMCGERFECLTLLKEHVYYGHRSGEEVVDLEKTCYRRVVNGWKSPMRGRIGDKNSSNSPVGGRLSRRNGSKSPVSSRISGRNCSKSPESSRISGKNSSKSPESSRISGKNSSKSPESGRVSKRNGSKSPVISRISGKNSSKSSVSSRISGKNSSKSSVSSRIGGRNSSKSPENGTSWRCERDRSVGRVEKCRRSMENCGKGDENGGKTVGNRCRSGENAGDLSGCGRVVEKGGSADENRGKAVENYCRSGENEGELSGCERVVESCVSRDEIRGRSTESDRRCKGRKCLKTGESFRRNLEDNYVEKVVVDKVEKLLGKNGENLRIAYYCRGKNEKPSGNSSYGILKYTVPYSNQASRNVNWSENPEVSNRCHRTTGCTVSNNEKQSKIVNGCDENSNETISVETKKSVSPSRSFEDVPVLSTSEDEASLESGNDYSERDYCSLISNNYTKVLDCDSDELENRSELPIDSSRLSYKFKCYDCENLYQTLQDLECHRRLAHDSDVDVPDIMSCDHCGGQFTKRTLLEGHFRKCVCSICGFTSRCWTLLRLHCSSKHGTRGDWSCDKCRRRFRTSVMFVKHARNCRGIVVRKERKRRRFEGSLEGGKLVKHPKFKRIRTLDDDDNYENCDTNLSSRRTKNKRIPTLDDDDHDNCKTNLSTRGTKYKRIRFLDDDDDDNYESCNTNLSTRGKKYKRIRLLDGYDDDDNIVVNTNDKYCNTYSPTSPTNLKNTGTFRIVLKTRPKKISPRNFKGSPKKSFPRCKQKSPQKSPSKSSTDEDFVKPKLKPKSMTTPQRKRVEFLKSMRENCESSPDKNSPKLKAIRESDTKLEFSPGEDNKIGVGISKSVRKNGEMSFEKVGPIETPALISGRTNNVSPTSNRSKVGNIWRSRRNLGKLTPPKDLRLVEDRYLKGELKSSPKNSVSDFDGDSNLARKLKKDFIENLDVKPLDNTLDSTKELIIDTSVSYCQSVNNDSYTKNHCILEEEKRTDEIPTDVTRTDFFLNLNLVSSTPINGVRKSKEDLFQGKLNGKISGEDMKDGRKFCRQLISDGDTSKAVNCEASPNRVPTSILKTVPSVKSKSTLRRIVHFEDDVDEKFGCKFLKNVSPDSSRSSVEIPSEKNDSNVVVSSAKSENVEESCKPSNKLQIYRCRLCKKRFPNKDLLQCHVTSNVCRVKISNLS